MKKQVFALWLVVCLIGVGMPAQQKQAEAPERIALPAPMREGGMALNETLAKRESVRQYTDQAITQKELGQLLWAAQGITRPNGHRTAPSAVAIYPLELYAVTPGGTFHYVPDGHQMERISGNDLRPDLAKVSRQPSVPQAAAVFIFTAVWERMDKRLGEAQHARSVNWTFAEAGHAAENLLLEAVALNLVGVPMGGFDGSTVQQALAIPKGHVPIYMVAVGHHR
jgi:SagB-type dehydrogenase family enzyme